jgi:hypothetical protein
VPHRMAEQEEMNELLAEMRVLTPDDPGFETRASASASSSTTPLRS